MTWSGSEIQAEGADADGGAIWRPGDVSSELEWLANITNRRLGRTEPHVVARGYSAPFDLRRKRGVVPPATTSG